MMEGKIHKFVMRKSYVNCGLWFLYCSKFFPDRAENQKLVLIFQDLELLPLLIALVVYQKRRFSFPVGPLQTDRVSL